VAQYETLRKAAFGDALPLDARAGLMLFLHRGMWGWARAVAAMSAFAQPEGSRPSNWTTPEEYKPFIYVFAAMAIQTSHQGAIP